MLSNLCQELKNWFDRGQPKLYGGFKIEGGEITNETFLSEIKPNQYFRIIGSVFNDGVYKYTSELELSDEEFSGSIWLMAIPKEFINLAEEIADWIDKNNGIINSPFQSESFGGYSYTKSESSGQLTWQSTFASELNKWRKI